VNLDVILTPHSVLHRKLYLSPMHLFLPLLASILFVCGLILIKRAGVAGAGPVTTLFFANEFSAVAFSVLWLIGGPGQPWTLLWQPCVIAVLFMLGLMFTFLAVERGDVSIAAPVFGMKVVIVALLLTWVGNEQLPATLWYAAILAAAGIALIQSTGRRHPKRVVFTLMFAFSAATTFATFDVLVQDWAPAWGAGVFLPIVYAMVGLLSLGMIPWVEWSKLRSPSVRRYLLPGATMFALQSVCIVVTVAVFGDAARVNVVYALRGLWGVGLAWVVARIWGGAEAELGRSVMLTRLVGACLLTSAVVFAIVSQR
jgi:drug/metabolite transporter (DMT)-like permease